MKIVQKTKKSVTEINLKDKTVIKIFSVLIKAILVLLSILLVCIWLYAEHHPNHTEMVLKSITSKKL